MLRRSYHMRTPAFSWWGSQERAKSFWPRPFTGRAPASQEPLVAVNVGETPPTLIEDALFGHEKGAFTDAKDHRIGFFEQAGRGALFSG